MNTLNPAAAAAKHSSEQGEKALAHTDHALQVLQLLTIFGLAGAAVGAVIALVSMRALRAGWEWAFVWVVLLGIAIFLVYAQVLSGDAAIATVTGLSGLSAGHLGVGIAIQLGDRRSGDDRGHNARQRIGPHHLVLRWIAFRRARGMAGLGDLPIGVTRRGRMASIKRGGESGSHSLIVGATGAGKSTLLGLLAFEYAFSGHGVVMVEAKRDPDLEAQARRAAARWGRPFILVSSEGPTVWDVLATGGVDETVSKLLACEEWSEAFYLAESTRFLRWVVRTMEGCGTRPTLQAVLGLCEPDRLAAHAAKHGNPALTEELGRFLNSLTPKERTDIAGLRSRLAVLAESEFGRQWLDPDSGAGPVLDLAEAIRRRAIVYFRLDAERFGIVAEKIGAAIAIELGAIASDLHDHPIPTFVGIDEIGALDSDHAERLFTRGRAAGFSVSCATHTLEDLRAGGEAFEARVSATIDSVLGLRMGPDDADAVARLAGQVGANQHTTRTAGLLGIAGNAGTRTRGYRMRLHPSVLQNLGFGQCAVIRLDRGDRHRAVIAEVVPSWERGYCLKPRPTKWFDPYEFDDRELAGVWPKAPDYFGTGTRRQPLLPF